MSHDSSGREPDWVTTRFGVQVTSDGTGHAEHEVRDLVVLGLRHNKRRAHLLVSTVLGKHIPTPPHVVRRAADDLGAAIIEQIGADPARNSIVFGFAETATGLGHCVAQRISASRYLHSTRRRLPGVVVSGTFEEGHSHATTHLLQPSDPRFLDATTPDETLILVDDEISTGTTALGAIETIIAKRPRARFVVASLVDMRSADQRAICAKAAADLGVEVSYVALAHGSVTLPPTLLDEVWELTSDTLNPVVPERAGVTRIDLDWPRGTPDGGRHGFARSDAGSFRDATEAAAAAIAEHLDPQRPVVVVGHEELMYAPLCIAEGLEQRGFVTGYQTTTRSPAQVHNVPGYPLRRGFRFRAPESDPETPRYIYNVSSDALPDPQVVIVIDTPADTPELRSPGGLLDVLTTAGHPVTLAILPATDQAQLRASRQAVNP
ncbi:phosphoribosyltransferase family protein [Gordonia alkanivorans]|uniref:phosphoribosyltransferase family protein n=1 Tax=Gordonia alkanivorans TaxID=84096 RepID=UPI00244ACC9A|nr:phosphoribosyltransferase family protein [Gordonia alkanivorans]MDH3020694.1 phosphoribosyltransferase family protein [Gordonia alkanivorans]MDJ0008155.1 phosphoribosyltransferase family protein [Gordonia alkanivorans]MDJ0097686.1 phosphoribosyltransferase family protein [Gordonia alkanivorans]MDJ0493729.1 phosphoribosyltransferase family protein [Gordonia alkanivorans]